MDILLESTIERAHQGIPEAQWALGTGYSKGDGLPQSYAEAVKWWRKAADQGFSWAQNDLGLAYIKGLGVPQDFGEAVKSQPPR
ncbi:MAG: tetratricopeptide repeat protein [Pseudomonadota bacterium]|nr:tetratricopeptide repeat protein [Pseudomonadota bacterium]